MKNTFDKAVAEEFVSRIDKLSANSDRVWGSLYAAHFEGKESNSFGALNSTEWNNMLDKHLDHHLNQFGV